MKFLYSTVILLLVFSFKPYTSSAQGCSDAGFCSISSFKPEENDSAKNAHNQLKIGMNLGAADHSIMVVGNYIEYNRQVSERLSFDAKLTSLAQTGNDISEFGLSDLYVNVNYKIRKSTGLTLGVKIPLMDGNKMMNGLSLPMDYQASLGTFDLLVGIAQEIKKFQIVVALQQPLTQNSNGFLAPMAPLNSPLRTFQSTNEYQRSGDALVRLSYPFELNKKLKLTPSILSIYHLAEDKYTNILDVEESIVGSQGLTLNANVYLDYSLNEKSNLQLIIAAPMIVRDARPDGLTRSFVVNLEYKFRF